MGKHFYRAKKAYRKVRKAYRIATLPLRGAVRLVKVFNAARKAAKHCNPYCR